MYKMIRLIYILHFLFLSRLIVVVNSYTLLNRSEHTANHVNGRIYFLGGATSDTNTFTNDFFYLDVSAPFKISSDSILPIVDLTNVTDIPKHLRATSTACGPNRDTIFLFGGEIESGKVAPLVAFDTKNQLWNVVNEKGTIPTRRRFLPSVCDNDARMYVFGGTTSPEMGSPFAFRDDFNILDTTKKNFFSPTTLIFENFLFGRTNKY